MKKQNKQKVNLDCIYTFVVSTGLSPISLFIRILTSWGGSGDNAVGDVIQLSFPDDSDISGKLSIEACDIWPSKQTFLSKEYFLACTAANEFCGKPATSDKDVLTLRCDTEKLTIASAAKILALDKSIEICSAEGQLVIIISSGLYPLVVSNCSNLTND